MRRALLSTITQAFFHAYSAVPSPRPHHAPATPPPSPNNLTHRAWTRAHVAAPHPTPPRTPPPPHAPHVLERGLAVQPRRQLLLLNSIRCVRHAVRHQPRQVHHRQHGAAASAVSTAQALRAWQEAPVHLEHYGVARGLQLVRRHVQREVVVEVRLWAACGASGAKARQRRQRLCGTRPALDVADVGKSLVGATAKGEPEREHGADTSSVGTGTGESKQGWREGGVG